jgi:hypothetical protein
MPYLSNIITSVVVARSKIGLCIVIGCYMSHITVIIPIGPFECITKSDNTQTNTTSSNNHKSGSVAQTKDILSHDNTQTNSTFNTNHRSASVAQMRHITTHRPILHPATTSKVLMLHRRNIYYPMTMHKPILYPATTCKRHVAPYNNTQTKAMSSGNSY